MVLWTIAAFAWATPVAAQPAAPTTTAFDGTYVGVSSTFEEDILGRRTWSSYCPPSPGPPGDLTIVNGVARSKWGGPIEGSVNPQGLLVMRNANGSRIEAQLAGHGTVTARWTGGCSYQLVWQKVPPPTMPYDGDYVGVSRESTGSSPECPSNGVPSALIIRNSAVLGVFWQGSVSQQGNLVIQTPRGLQARGQIDNQGVIRVQGGNSACTVILAWRKQSG
jgi:hypothetical protein